jgi:hypothetical protein
LSASMTVLVRIQDESGRETRRCDARCHRSDPLKPSHCCCLGMLKGCERDGRSALDVDPTYLALVRETITLNPGEHVQMRIGA